MSSISSTEFVTRIATPVLVACVIGLFGFATSRAGHDDLDRVESDMDSNFNRVQSDISAIEEKL